MELSTAVKTTAAATALSVSLIVGNATVAHASEADAPKDKGPEREGATLPQSPQAALKPLVREGDAAAASRAEKAKEPRPLGDPTPMESNGKTTGTQPAKLDSGAAASDPHPSAAPQLRTTGSGSKAASPAHAPAHAPAQNDPTQELDARLDGTIQSFVSETQSKEDVDWQGFSDQEVPTNSTSASAGTGDGQAKPLAGSQGQTPQQVPASSTSSRRLVLRAAATAGGGGGTGVVADKAGGMEAAFQVQDETGAYLDLYDYLRKHVDVSVVASEASIVSVDGVAHHHGLDFLWSPLTYRFAINDKPQSVPDAVGQYRVHASVTLSDGSVLEAESNVFKIYPMDVTFSDLVAQHEHDRQAGRQNEYFLELPYISTLKGLGLAQNQDATTDQKRDMATFSMPEGDSWVNGSSEKGVYTEVGNATNADSERLLIKSGSRVTFNNMKFNSSVRIVVEKGAVLVLRQSCVFGKIEVHGTLMAPNGSTVTDTIYLRPGATIKDAKIASHARYLTDGNLTKPETDVVVVSDGNTHVEGTVTIEGDSGSSERQGQVPFVVHTGTVYLGEGARLNVRGGTTDLVYAQDGGDGILMFDGTAIVGHGTVVAVGGGSKVGTAGAGLAMADGGSAQVSVDKLVVTGGDSAAEGEATLPFEGSSRQAGNGIGAGVDVSGTKEVTSQGGAGLKPGADDANAQVVESESFSGVSSFAITWHLTEGAHKPNQVAPADYSGYTLTVGVFDATGREVLRKAVAYAGDPLTIEGLEPAQAYTVRVLGVTDDQGRDATRGFQTAIRVDVRATEGQTRQAWTQKASGLQVDDRGVAIVYQSKGRYYALGMDESHRLVGREVRLDEDGSPLGIDGNFRWDVEQGPYNLYGSGSNLRLSIHGTNYYLAMGYSGPSLRSSGYYDYDFVFAYGTIQGNGSYRKYLCFDGEKAQGAYDRRARVAIWELSETVTPGTKAVAVDLASDLRSFDVRWVDEDGMVLDSARLHYGQVPVFAGEEPTKAADARFAYQFADWDREPEPIRGNTTYRARFSATPLPEPEQEEGDADHGQVPDGQGAGHETAPGEDGHKDTEAGGDRDAEEHQNPEKPVDVKPGEVADGEVEKAADEGLIKEPEGDPGEVVDKDPATASDLPAPAHLAEVRTRQSVAPVEQGSAPRHLRASAREAVEGSLVTKASSAGRGQAQSLANPAQSQAGSASEGVTAQVEATTIKDPSTPMASANHMASSAVPSGVAATAAGVVGFFAFLLGKRRRKEEE